MPVLEWIPLVTISSFVLFVVWSVLITLEQKRGKRVFARRFRDYLDVLLEKIIKVLSVWYVTITRHKVKLSWYYSIHAILVAVLAFLGTTYTRIENIVIANRDKARKIRKEKNSLKKSHLTEIAEHKISVQLTKKEQKERKDASLKGK